MVPNTLWKTPNNTQWALHCIVQTITFLARGTICNITLLTALVGVLSSPISDGHKYVKSVNKSAHIQIKTLNTLLEKYINFYGLYFLIPRGSTTI